MSKYKFSMLDLILIALVIATGAYLFYRVRSGLNYNWDWEAIPQYLFRYDSEREKWLPNLLIQGLFTTIKLSIWSIISATIVGTIMGLFRVSPSLFKRLIGGTYVEIIRNTPPIVLIFIFYFFFSSQIIPAIGLEDFIMSASDRAKNILGFLFAPPPMFCAFISAIATLALLEGAYIAEIVRAGIASIEKGQWEASYALGFSRWQQIRHIIMPQAIQRTLPPLAGQFISTIKDSAIVSVISVQELTFQGMELMSATYLTFEIWITITLMYLILTLSLSLAIRRLELYTDRKIHG